MEITIEEIQKKFESLPEDLRWAIMGADVDNKIIEIGKENNLKVEEMGQLSLEVHAVMLGFIHPNQFEASVQESLKFDPNKTRTLVNAVNEKILKNIREQIMLLYKNRDHENTAIKEEEIKKEDKNEIFKNAGIEIVENNNQFEKKEEVAPKDMSNMSKGTLDIPFDTQNTQKTTSISEQKLAGVFQIPKTTTEYTTNPASASVNNPVAKPPTDPYRMPIE